MAGRPVPWVSWEEWKQLRDDLWSADPARQESGRQHVCVWRLRGKLPLGVDATAQLLDARRADEEWQRAVAWASQASSLPSSTARAANRPAGMVSVDAAVAAGELPLRLRYSLPLIRLVNGISDSQQRGKVAASVAVLSEVAGLPRALVDVRHEATHNELPSLPLLRAAADSALSWLRDNYWDGQSRALAAVAERIGGLLTTLADSWRAAMAAGMTGGGGGSGAGMAEEDEEDDEDEEEGTAADAAGSYSGVKGQRLRRQAMSELRSLVPAAFTHELLKPVLDCPVFLPPEPPQLQVRPSAGQQLEEQQQQHRQQLVEEKAWRAVMKHLLKWYPLLRPLLLQAAVQQLAAPVSGPPAAAPPVGPLGLPCGAPGPEEVAAAPEQNRARAYLRWVMRLLPAGAAAAPLAPISSQQVPGLGSPGRKQRGTAAQQAASSCSGGGKSSKRAAPCAAVRQQPPGGGGGGNDDGGPSLDGPLAPEQLKALLRIASAHLASRPTSDAVGGSGSGAGDRGGGEDPGAGSLGVTSGLWPASAGMGAESACGGAGASATGPREECLKDVVMALQRALEAATGVSEEGGQRPCQMATAVEHAEGVAGTAADSSGRCTDAPAAPGQQERQPPREQRPRKWQRCEGWSRCAIGCLPCALNPNGRIPALVPPPPPPPAPQPLCPDGAGMGANSGSLTTAAGQSGAGLSAVPEPQEPEVEYYLEPEDGGVGLAPVGQGEEGQPEADAGGYGGGLEGPYGDVYDDEGGEDQAGPGRQGSGEGGGGGAGLLGALLRRGPGGSGGPSGGVGFLL